MKHQSQFRREFAIIPVPAKIAALVVFGMVHIAMTVIAPHYDKTLPPQGWWMLITFVISTILAIIILMIGYVYADSKRRGMNALLWTLLVIVVPKALGFIAYFLLRKPLMVTCPNCANIMGSDFRFCPKCGYAIAPVCPQCGRPISGDYVCCPYCGKPVQSAPPQNSGTLTAK
jgi:RNA polymerase subunit RPABC4/transcription elongation factor Spt4